MSDFVKKKRLPGPADELEYLACLPASRGALPDGFHKAAYAEGEGPSENLPKGITIESLRQLMSVVPMRSNNVTLRGWHTPKSAGPSFMPAGNMWQHMGMFWPRAARAHVNFGQQYVPRAVHPGRCFEYMR